MASYPLLYRLFFLWIEPIATLVGAYYAWFQPQVYLELTHTASAPGLLGMPVGTHLALRQLGNLYFCFALNEAFVLRATSDLRVWRTLLLGLLIADFGHLYSCSPLGLRIYYEANKWNSIYWGNIAFVYCGATTRICFLTGVGMGGPRKAKAKAKRTFRTVANDTGLVPSAKMEQTTPKSPNKSNRRKKNKSIS